MPVRSLGSSVLRWPDREEVDRAVRDWAARIAALDERVLRVGYFGSYARGDWGVGSDVDLVVIVAEAAEPLERRALAFDATDLPVPADVFVYTEGEWEAMLVRGGLPRTASREVAWVLER
jgi:predicted nucleotidyltransferase